PRAQLAAGPTCLAATREPCFLLLTAPTWTNAQVCLQSNVYLPALHSFPTRRSSDLVITLITVIAVALPIVYFVIMLRSQKVTKRSEEHTSELQSRFDVVCRLLLEKKKRAPGRAGTRRGRAGRHTGASVSVPRQLESA